MPYYGHQGTGESTYDRPLSAAAGGVSWGFKGYAPDRQRLQSEAEKSWGGSGCRE